MEVGDIIICKKKLDRRINRKRHRFQKWKEYKISYVSDLSNILASLDLKYVNPIILTIGKDFYIGEEDFHNYFYTPEETKNIKRNRLMNKMLGEAKWTIYGKDRKSIM
jgi:hypothetical protein